MRFKSLRFSYRNLLGANLLGALPSLARPQQKLAPHFIETRAAILVVKHVEQSEHDRTPSFDRR
jgi:hypothetical protein